MTAFRKLTSREISHASSLTWYALSVPPQREFRVQRILCQRGLSAFVPQEWRYRKKSRYCKKAQRKGVAAYPRVVFVGVPDGRGFPWLQLNDIHLVSGYIACPSTLRPQVFLSSDVQQIMSASRTPLFTLADEAVYEEPSFEPGEPVEIGDGPLAGIELKVDRVVGMDVFCRFELMGREVEQKLPADILSRRWAA